MSEINTEYLQRCIDTLEKSYMMLQKSQEGTIDYELYRNSLVKGFEMTIEQSGKLLKKKLNPYFASKKAVDALSFKDIFRYAHKHSLLTEEEAGRWMKYRDNRNSTAHDHGQAFAEETLALMDDFLSDVKNLKKVIDDA
ncbi:MAG: nucleotidyltransferase substrate binding protein [Bacteroidales bacterium]|nr:nucleotidyltransferase substrate binding protein [Bacteroidales bacterium]MCM1416701.1 nucleotidyltransferase substrate binding protein [bacterium]MCM1423990.1 nucleotidyltransferase substrate binding protein [bacterium]